MSEFLDRNEAPSGPLQTVDEDDSTMRLMHKDVDRSRGERRWRYPEWDDDLGDYKPSWVGVIEFHLAAGDTGFVDDVLAEHGYMIDRLRRTFEAMRPEHMRPKRGLNDGDTLDMDAVIAARIARKAGVSGPAGIYRARRPAERDVSVAFLVDMSSSTNEHINSAGKRIIDVEREALVVTAEAVDALGDQMAIYGYSGFGREAVAFYVAKEFDEPYGPTIRQRIGRMGWKLENRDGAAIRHAVRRLGCAPSKTRLLILLSTESLWTEAAPTTTVSTRRWIHAWRLSRREGRVCIRSALPWTHMLETICGGSMGRMATPSSTRSTTCLPDCLPFTGG